MREHRDPLRWVLLLVLALGVVLMHHVPAQAHEPAPVAAAAHAVGHSPAAAHAVGHSPVTAHTDHAPVAQVEHHGHPASPGHAALHLCLAIVVGFLVLLLPRLRRAARAVAGPPRALVAAPPALAPPPIPVPRRLAALCVLRH
ncbi:hypothetical protein [Saccharopolyspora hordei]|uniref:Uncharacterized protein n=1 Tax=Saccharopolyspora hordei TaxID=1838 RepID=A0A853AJD4_9PSEU|nr:hypothetical protein [Saccharopolyspora hordei]NYI84128.1 hypothetical protein [Saccharopolyspora hordei]